ncbi:MAG: GGDEF domain-containing protein [Aquihabitans sp.]
MATSPAVPVLVGVDALPVAAAVIDATGCLVAVNAAMRSLAGRDCTRQMITDLGDVDVWTVVAEILAAPDAFEKVSSPAPSVLASPVRHPVSGVVHHVWISAPDADQSRVVVAAPISGITEDAALHDAAADLAVLDDAAAQAHELMGHGVIVGDGQRLLHVSAGAARLFGRSSQDLIELGSLFSLFELGEQLRLSQLVEERRVLNMDPLEHFETTILRPDGSLLPVELWVKAKVEGGTVRTYTLIADARERRAQHLQLAHRALHDQLTGLPNRFLLMDRLATVLERVTRQGGSAVLAFIDLDRFKAINDVHGHNAGDVVLQATAERIRAGLRSCDTVARVGGDEFVVLCSDGPGHQAVDVLTARLRELVCCRVEGDGWSVDVEASIGAVAFADGVLDADTLLAHADLAMYAVKRDRTGSAPR